MDSLFCKCMFSCILAELTKCKLWKLKLLLSALAHPAFVRALWVSQTWYSRFSLYLRVLSCILCLLMRNQRGGLLNAPAKALVSVTHGCRWAPAVKVSIEEAGSAGDVQ